MSKSLTKRQKQILDFVSAEVRKKGYPPSVREIGSAVGLSSSSTVHSHLAALEKKGLVKRDPSKPRALLLSNRERPGSDRSIAVPLLGQVAAGRPILADENIEDNLAWPKEFSSAPSFALRVKGDSMTGDGIFDGDIAMVRRQETAENGDLVVALINDEATVKRFFKEPQRVRLEPSNPSYEPIYGRDVAILGRVVGLLRRF